MIRALRRFFARLLAKLRGADVAIPTFVAGNVLTAAQLNTITTALPIVDAWTAYTPQIDQGASTNIAKTNVYSRYVKVGRFVHVIFDVTLTAAGSATAAIAVSLPPFTPVSTGQPLGIGFFVDASTGNISVAAVVVVSSTRVNLWAADANTPTKSGGLGNDSGAFNGALASGDQIRASFTYESTT